MHVVVVDDEPRMVELVTGYLSEHDVQVTGAHDGPTGLFAARQADVDAVVLDLMLPGMSGTQVCRQLRKEGNLSSLSRLGWPEFAGRLAIIVGYLLVNLLVVGSFAFALGVWTDAPLAAVGGAVSL